MGHGYDTDVVIGEKHRSDEGGADAVVIDVGWSCLRQFDLCLPPMERFSVA